MVQYTEWRSISDGSIISSIPDTSMFQDTIYQWWAEAGIDVGDGEEAGTWEDQLSQIVSSSEGSPTFREDQDGFPAVEFDGSNDGHNWDSDSQLPTGNDPFSVAVMFQVNDNNDDSTMVSWGEANEGDGFYFEVDNGGLRAHIWGQPSIDGGSVTENQIHTAGVSFDGSEFTIYLDGSEVGSGSVSASIADDNHAIGWTRFDSRLYFNGYIYEVLPSGTDEDEQAFSDYHDDRLE